MTSSAVQAATRDSADYPTVEELVAYGRGKMLLFDVEGYAQAVRSFEEALGRSPDDAAAHAALGQTCSYWARRREISGQECLSYYRRAHEHARRALERAPGLGEAHRAMAAALSGGERKDPAARLREIERAMEINPYDAENCYEYWRARGYAPDDPAIYKAIILQPNLCGAHIDLGVAFYERGRVDESAFHFDRALKINPRNSLALYNLAMVLRAKGLAREALDTMRRSAAMHPQDPLVLGGLMTLERDAARAAGP